MLLVDKMELRLRQTCLPAAQGSHSIHLSPREYTLLEFFAFHRGRILTRSIIWEHLYDDRDENTSNVVDVHSLLAK